MKCVTDIKIVKRNIRSLVEGALADAGGLLRLAPCWVPRSFLHPGRRLKLHPDDLYAYGLNRGGIDERWFTSTTPAANENRNPDEGLSCVTVANQRFTLADAISECGPEIIGQKLWRQYHRWPVYSKFFDNLGPIPRHMHQTFKHAKLVGQEGKPESYFFPPQHNNVGNHFPHTFYGLEPGTTRAQVRRCLDFTAKELTIEPGVKCLIKDPGAYGLIVVQGSGRMNRLNLDCPKLIRFHEMTEDEVFCTADAARIGVTFENTSEVEPLVTLRYFGPEVNPDAPGLGAYRKNKWERS
jgi:hypothetical protein